ncbi:MAG: BON domain-containing protein [Cryomorphaceae bacterium]|jgi:osmotically-inducible protein OsmY|nr:BON domain-containing protein [Cryomorphaceae bacterium]
MKTDVEIQKDVMDELKWELVQNANEIGVAVKDGIVTLTGAVDSYYKKLQAERAAKKVLGVKAVAQDMTVQLIERVKRTDSEIASAVINALAWHSSIPEEKIKIKVEKGWVTLEGEVEWDFQRNYSRKAVENLQGVVGISNNIRIAPKLKSADIKNKIFSAFHRSATLDSDSINITTDGSKVVLSGKVRSFVEKKDAEKAAYLAPGVTEVENKLVIDTEVYSY